MTHGAKHIEAATHSGGTGWQQTLDSHGNEYGFHRLLDERHGALFTEDDETLLVTFEPLESFRDGPAPNLPMGLQAAGREGWSHLCLYCEGTTFFRSEAVYAFFDEMVDDGFFDRFDRVIFYGAGACGYAAGAFSVTAPGATVLLIRPLATLAPDMTPWDHRYPEMRRTDFEDRYGYAPDMLEAAERVILLHDPQVPEDAMHATLFGNRDVIRLDVPRLGNTPEKDLAQMEILFPLLRSIARPSFEPRKFFALYRARRNHRPYLSRMQRLIESRGRPALRNSWTQAAEKRIVTKITSESWREAFGTRGTG